MHELSNLCKGQFPTQMHRKVDGAVIKSRNDKNLDCTVTFSTEYVSQRFHIRFEEFSMACGDHLYIYDSANAIGNPRSRPLQVKKRLAIKYTLTQQLLLFCYVGYDGAEQSRKQYGLTLFVGRADGKHYKNTLFLSPSLKLTTDYTLVEL
ncbi:hypothetical protein Ocin01_07068 [Orchesella cincta]|uniref:CUB domain-containing protein n=1 Tax=Orchesella cincta TaxID=48709 RepID=A0A1D2N318_ORCCI|nr:hypothetical protein Ocin01_07068 [Orchesella cincta]